MNPLTEIEEIIKASLKKIGLTNVPVQLSIPPQPDQGDICTNVALTLAKQTDYTALELSQVICEGLESNFIERAEAVSPGFINLYYSDLFKVEILQKIAQNDSMSKGDSLHNQHIVVEYTDPNPFKLFHVGHVMSNAIGEAIARLLETQGAQVSRANYQGDVGLHVAKTIYGMQLMFAETGSEQKDLSTKPLPERIAWLGQAYKRGSETNKENLEAIEKINIAVAHIAHQELVAKGENPYPPPTDLPIPYEIIKRWYLDGRQWSLDYFELLYQKLGTKFDQYYFESQTAVVGERIVQKGLREGIFELSEGAVIFRGEREGLHNRVFINSQGMPTYEAKDLGLAFVKKETSPYDLSIIITGNEVNDYFQVVLKALGKIDSDLARKTKHLGHGMMRLEGGKMSSRTGEVVPAEALLEASLKKTLALVTAKHSAEELALGAIKYSILAHSIGNNITYNEAVATQIVGNTGPYLQYTHARATSIINEVQSIKLKPLQGPFHSTESALLNVLLQYNQQLLRASEHYNPSILCAYLFTLSQGFNSLYNDLRILQADQETDRLRRIALTKTVMMVLKHGLGVLGLPAPEKV